MKRILEWLLLPLIFLAGLMLAPLVFALIGKYTFWVYDKVALL